VVQLFVRTNPDGSGRACTGTLIAPNVVLTAYHCVGIESGTTVSCPDVTSPTVIFHEDGDGFTGASVAPDVVMVSTERTHASADEFTPAAHGVEIITESPSVLCSHDIAAVILNTSITTIRPLPVRTVPMTTGERLTAVGWGIDGDGNSPLQRMHRTDVAVVATAGDIFDFSLGDGAVESNGVSPGEFLTGVATCHGDSGGPMIDGAGEVAGITSRGGDDCNAQVSTFTDPAAHADFVTSALARGSARIAGPAMDGGAAHDAATATCTVDLDCNPGKSGRGTGLICAHGACVPGCHTSPQCPGLTLCIAGHCK
jgi:secreted trypsin-like serine protease